jgi:hypothetical protein
MPRPVRWPPHIRDAIQNQRKRKEIDEEARRAAQHRTWREIGKLALFLLWHGIIQAMTGNRRR